MIGQTVSHYKILEKLGEGGMGIVYKAQDLELDRIVALKFLSQQMTSSDNERIRFLQEAKAASSLNHPNVCIIYGIDEYEGQKFIEMEYVNGTTLRNAIAKSPLEINDAVSYALQIGEALNEAHSKGIVHRDIKSENIMLNSKNQIKVMDFGLAKLKGSVQLTKTRSTVGTLAYMAPEQIQGETGDYRSDIFSFGVVFFEMLTGRLPFRGEHEAAMVYSIVNEQPVSLRSLQPSVSERLDDIISRCLKKDKQQRYQNVNELLIDLRNDQQGRAIIPETTQNHSMRSWIVGAFVLVLLFGAGYFYFKSTAGIVNEPTTTAGGSNGPSRQKSIAILPFDNLSDNKENEYFSDGITEDIITQLSKIADLKVISRTSVMQYKNTKKNMREIGKELGVGTVLEGSVRRSGNQLRIVAQLIDATTDQHLWSNTFDREMKDVFAVQDDITGHIVSALTIALNGTERHAMSSSRTSNPTAHDLYLQGRFQYNQFTGESLNRAIEYFQQALREDPGYAEPYTGIAFAYGALADFYLPPHEAYPRSKSAAQKALEIDSTNGEAHVALGVVLIEYEWNFISGEEQMRRALQLSPNSIDVNIFYSQCAGIRGRLEEALKYADQAITLDPLSPVASWSKEWYLYWARKYDAVIEQHKRTAEIDPNFLYWDNIVGAAYREKGMLKEALAEYLRAQKISPERPLFGLAITYARMGKFTEARKILEALEEDSKKRYVAPDQIAMIYANLGEKDRAFEWLKKAYDGRSAGMAALKIYAEYDPIRSDPRFILLLKKIGLEQ